MMPASKSTSSTPPRDSTRPPTPPARTVAARASRSRSTSPSSSEANGRMHAVPPLPLYAPHDHSPIPPLAAEESSGVTRFNSDMQKQPQPFHARHHAEDSSLAKAPYANEETRLLLQGVENGQGDTCTRTGLPIHHTVHAINSNDGKPTYYNRGGWTTTTITTGSSQGGRSTSSQLPPIHRRPSRGLLLILLLVLILPPATYFYLSSRSPEFFTALFNIMKLAFKTVVSIVLGILGLTEGGSAAPGGGPPASVLQQFPPSGKVLWYTSPGTAWAKSYLPIANGYIAAMVKGGTAYEDITTNLESLWSGGPFQSPDYNGGNSPASDAPKLRADMQTIRQALFNSSTGTVQNELFDVLAVSPFDYGSYASPGRFAITMASPSSSSVSNFARWLDLDQGVAKSQWDTNGTTISRQNFCSHPGQACFHTTTSSSASHPLTQTYAFFGPNDIPQPTSITCLDNSTLLIRGVVWNPGMTYELLARVSATAQATVSCSASSTSLGNGNTQNATIHVSGAHEVTLTWVGGTNFDQAKSTPEAGYSFLGDDPHDALVTRINMLTAPQQHQAANESAMIAAQLKAHLADISSTLSTGAPFQLNLGQKTDLTRPTNELFETYKVDEGNPYLELLAFEFGRYLLWASARGVLPSNLQGIWARDGFNPWGCDYHSNINIQMNYWSAEPTGLDIMAPLFTYFEQNWVPRGQETAQILYNISRGWVVHNEMNIFGYSGMKGGGGSASYADYPEANAWMMIHVWDHFDYTNDIAWWKAQGWPLIKSAAAFHLDKLIPDEHFNDGTLVVAPCNSPEQGQISFGCAHSQQVIWQLFNAVEKGFDAAGDGDVAFLKEVQDKRAKMDKGLHIGSWGQLQEWKFDMDSPTDLHRHLSHLIGIYPGYAVSSYAGQTSFSKQDIVNAATTSLTHRGNGTGPDADAGWEKAWRAAAWAQLGNASVFYHELTYTLQRDFGSNLFSLYNPGDADPIFQIDANLGFPGAVLNALLHAPDVPTLTTPLTVTLLPALPTAWNTGSFQGMRARWGLSVDLSWQNGKPTTGKVTIAKNAPQGRQVNIIFAGKTITSFKTSAGAVLPLKF